MLVLTYNKELRNCVEIAEIKTHGKLGKYSGLFSFLMFLFSNMFPLLKEYFNHSLLIYLSYFLHRQLWIHNCLKFI